MAIRLRLANLAQSSTFNFWDGTFKVQNWQSRMAAGQAIETFGLVAEGSDAGIISAENSLADLLYKAERFIKDPLEGTSIWLEANAASETAKRAFVYNGQLVPSMQRNISPLLGKNGAYFQLGLTRNPAWESVASTTGVSASALSVVGGMLSLADNGGTLDGRLSLLSLTGATVGGALTRFWLGIRPTYAGTGTFTPVWECEDGTNGTDATDTADASCSGGSKVRVDFATVATNAMRMFTTVITNIATPTHAVGRYLVLVRAMVTSGTVAMQMRTGYAQSQNLTPHKTVYISNTSAELIELGEITIPPFGYRSDVQGTNAVRQFMLQLWAERISGSGSLDLDCFILIPSEHMFYADGAELLAISGHAVNFYTFEDEQRVAIHYISDYPQANLEYAPTDWVYPKDGGVLVVAAQRDGAQVITDTLDVEYTMYPRWRTYAG